MLYCWKSQPTHTWQNNANINLPRWTHFSTQHTPWMSSTLEKIKNQSQNLSFFLSRNRQTSLTLMWLSLCNFSNKLQVTFLPVYKPSNEEIKDPKLFARNVRAVIAKWVDPIDSAWRITQPRLNALSHNLSLTFPLQISKLNLIFISKTQSILIHQSLPRLPTMHKKLNTSWYSMRFSLPQV